jgi:hypothetical protein
MNTQNSILILLQVVLPQTLILLVYLVGIVLALTRWRWHPRASLFTLLASFLGGASVVAVSTFHFVLQQTMNARSMNMEALRNLSVAINLGSVLVHVIVTSLLLVAIFARRDPPARPNPLSEPPVASA